MRFKLIENWKIICNTAKLRKKIDHDQSIKKILENLKIIYRLKLLKFESNLFSITQIQSSESIKLSRPFSKSFDFDLNHLIENFYLKISSITITTIWIILYNGLIWSFKGFVLSIRPI